MAARDHLNGEQMRLFDPGPTLPKDTGNPPVSAQGSSSKGIPNSIPLQMFMTGKELKDYLVSSFDLLRADEPMEDMWADKIKTAKIPAGSGKHGSGTYASLKEEGWQGRPLVMMHVDKDRAPNPDYSSYDIASLRTGENVSADAHHRIAASAELEEQEGKTIFIPLRHTRYEDQ